MRRREPPFGESFRPAGRRLSPRRAVRRCAVGAANSNLGNSPSARALPLLGRFFFLPIAGSGERRCDGEGLPRAPQGGWGIGRPWRPRISGSARSWRTSPSPAAAGSGRLAIAHPEGLGDGQRRSGTMMATRLSDGVLRACRAGVATEHARFLRDHEGNAGESEDSVRSAAGVAVASCLPMEHGIAHHGQCVDQSGGGALAPSASTASSAAQAPETEAPVANRDARARAEIVGALYQANYHRVFAFARKLVDDEVAEEVAHESFVRLFRVRNLERMSISVAYLLRIAENLVRRRHGRAQRFREILQASGRMVPDLESGPGQAVSATGTRASSDSATRDPDRIQAAMRQLTPSEQTAIRLIVCEGLDYQAAASSLGVPVSTINNWKHRALTKLRTLIESSRTGDEPAAGRASRFGDGACNALAERRRVRPSTADARAAC
ncbi:MAG: hypothetical protein RL136_51 [Planctomycetota bacterium]